MVCEGNIWFLSAETFVFAMNFILYYTLNCVFINNHIICAYGTMSANWSLYLNLTPATSNKIYIGAIERDPFIILLILSNDDSRCEQTEI